MWRQNLHDLIEEHPSARPHYRALVSAISAKDPSGIREAQAKLARALYSDKVGKNSATLIVADATRQLTRKSQTLLG